MKQTHDNEQGIAHLALILAAVAALAVGGVGYKVYDLNKSKQLAASQQKTDAADQKEAKVLPEELGELLPQEQVSELVAKDHPGAVVGKVELQTEGGVLVYKVVLSNGTVVAYNARTGARLVAHDGNEGVDDSAALPAAYKPAISFSKAVATAREKLPGKTVEKVQLEVEDGIVVFSVRFTDNSRVDVNAETGVVVRTRNRAVEKSSGSNSSHSQNQGTPHSGSGSDSSGGGSSNDHDSSSNDHDEDEDDGDSSNSGSGSSGSGSSN